ncbi:MAG: hypothetical protein WBD09_09830 [Halobacteriota archaeon]
MTNKDRTEDGGIAFLKKEVEYLKEKLNSVSESELSRNIETQKLKIHDIERTKIGISWLFHESKISGLISISSPLLPALFSYGVAQAILSGIFHGQGMVLQALGDVGFGDFVQMLNMVPLLVFIVAYVVGFRITCLITGIIVKHGILRREINKLKTLESH